MRLIDQGLEALIAPSHTGSSSMWLIGGAAALASLGVMAVTKKYKLHKKHFSHHNKSALFVPHEDAVTHALKTLKGADRKKAEALVKELTPAGFLRAIHAMDRWITHSPERGEKYIDALDNEVLRKHLHMKLPVGAFRGITVPITDKLAKSKAGAIVTIKPFVTPAYGKKGTLGKKTRGDTTSWTTDLATAFEFARPSRAPMPAHLVGKGFFRGGKRKPKAGVVLRCMPGGGARALLSPPADTPDWFLRLVHATWARQRELETRKGKTAKGLKAKKGGHYAADGLMSLWHSESEAIVKGPAKAKIFAVMTPGKPTRTA